MLASRSLVRCARLFTATRGIGRIASVVPPANHKRELHGSSGFLAAAAAEPAASTAVAAASPLLGPGAVQFLSVSPALAAQVLFLSPMSAMKQFKEDGTTGSVSVMPYAAMCANGAAWLTYGALGMDFTIMVPNASGLVFGAYYCQQFYKYRNPEATVMPYFGGGACFVAAVLGAAATLPAASAKVLIGYAGCTLTALMFVGPLASIQTVSAPKFVPSRVRLSMIASG